MKTIFYMLALFAVSKFSSAQSQPGTAFDFLDINNVKARINNGGDMWWDLVSDAAYVVPKSGNTSALFAGALWIGGIDANGQLKMAAQTYRQTGNDFFPGPLDQSGNIFSQTSLDFDRIWKVNKSTIDSFKLSLFAVTPASLSQWPGRGNPNLSFLPDQNLAPFTDVNGDGIYNPANGDFPKIPGDQALWFVFNDKGNTHNETGGDPLAVEVQCTFYAFAGIDDCVNTTTFYHYEIINKGTDLDSTFVGLWNDPDLGCAFDDYVGCDSSQNLAVVYNATAIDAGSGCIFDYGNEPPVVAIDFLKGPQDADGTIHLLDHFMYYQNDFTQIGNPESPMDYYNYLNATFKDGSHLTSGGDGYGGTEAANYAFPGDPDNATEWSECSNNDQPNDLRMILSSGPFFFQAGSVQTLDFSAVWDNSSVYPCPSFSNIKEASACVKNYFQENVQFTGFPTPASNGNAGEIYPNPISEDQPISFHLKNAVRVSVFDLSGRSVLEEETKNEVEFHVDNHLEPGMYIFQVLFNDHSMKSGKFIVQ